MRYGNVLDIALQDEDYGSQATISELVDQLKTFLFAGHDTSASMVAWTYYYLSLHPECHAKMKTEHDGVFGTSTDPSDIARRISEDPRILGRLEYTTAAMREALRFCPIGDGVRSAPEGYILRTSTGAEFDASGTIVNIQHNALHMKKSIWGPNVSKFDPDRFMRGNTIPNGYMPFAQRPRDCIGQNLAYLEGSHPYLGLTF
jgi:cytochrome P450